MMKHSLKKLVGRRSFLGSAAGLVGAGFWADETLDAAVQNVNTNSKPSELKITDMRIADLPGRPIIRLDTNQGIYGLGEVRDGASKTYALMLKRLIVGENPCSVDKLFRKIKQFGFHARQAGGVCGVEMALWDLAGKAYNVPDLADARRQVPRQDPRLCRHADGARPQGIRSAAEEAP